MQFELLDKNGKEEVWGIGGWIFTRTLWERYECPDFYSRGDVKWRWRQGTGEWEWADSFGAGNL